MEGTASEMRDTRTKSEKQPEREKRSRALGNFRKSASNEFGVKSDILRKINADLSMEGSIEKVRRTRTKSGIGCDFSRDRRRTCSKEDADVISKRHEIVLVVGDV